MSTIQYIQGTMAIYVIAILMVYAIPLQRVRDFGQRWFIKLGLPGKFWLCRTCLGFWIAIPVTLIVGGNVLDYFIVYGAAIFLATQEKRS